MELKYFLCILAGEQIRQLMIIVFKDGLKKKF